MYSCRDSAVDDQFDIEQRKDSANQWVPWRQRYHVEAPDSQPYRPKDEEDSHDQRSILFSEFKDQRWR